MNEETVKEIRKALHYIVTGACLGMFICMAIHFCVTREMHSMQEIARQEARDKAFEAIMQSLPETLGPARVKPTPYEGHPVPLCPRKNNVKGTEVHQ